MPASKVLPLLHDPQNWTEEVNEQLLESTIDMELEGYLADYNDWPCGKPTGPTPTVCTKKRFHFETEEIIDVFDLDVYITNNQVYFWALSVD